MAQAQRVQFEKRGSAVVQDCRRGFWGLLSARAGRRLRLQIPLECLELATERFVFRFELFDPHTGCVGWIFVDWIKLEDG